jgi:hypothetical protein
MAVFGILALCMIPRSFAAIVEEPSNITATAFSKGCGWVHNCGSRGCSDCKDDGSSGYKECCASSNCAWVNNCGARGCADCKDDGSQGFKECCGTGPSPSPGPTPSPGPAGQWCPSANDFTVAYGSPHLMDQGWEIQGNGGVATKSTFNLVGGFVEFDIDFSGVDPGVNANIYTISPSVGSSGYTPGNYCDGAKTGSGFCLEVDWIESNGNCGGATTLHTKEGPGSNGCTAWGCRASYHYNGRSSFHMRIEYGTDGSWTTIRDGQTIGGGSLSPQPSGWDWSVIKSNYETKGALIYSSEWVGWVPVDDCGKGPGNLDASHYKVSNLKISGSVVQGPTPRSCPTTAKEAMHEAPVLI